MLSLLPLLFSCKVSQETAIQHLQPAVRAQKQTKFNKLTGSGDYTLVAGNTMGITWNEALEKIVELKESGVNSVFSPLSAEEQEFSKR